MKASLYLIALVFVASPVVAQDRPVEGRWFCYSAEYDQPTMYVTPTWDGTGLQTEVANAFENLLVSKYNFKGRISCTVAYMKSSTFDKISTGNRAQVVAWQKTGKKIVETGWTFDPAKASLPHLCYGMATVRTDGKNAYYFYVNKVIRIPPNAQAALSTAFVDYMNRLHPGYYYQGVGCILVHSEPEAQQAQVTGTLEMYNHLKPTIERLDWDFKPPTAAAIAEDEKPAFYCQMLGGKEWYATQVQAADSSWKWEDYTNAWRAYAKNTLKLADYFVGACEPGKMKQQTVARATRKQSFVAAGGYTFHDVDWKYVPPQQPGH